MSEGPGAIIDRYKLLQEIGEGGFGIVYMAEQLEPVRRKVALKVIKLGMDTGQVVARFEAERQALALMDHPNIAAVLDAGATETGRPYFVMELVRGVPITEYCDEAQLDTAERLELFKQVCHALQHAHQKGIIHRDLKPNNILVTMHDGVPVPKVIDFGIAKATDYQLTEKTLFTEFRQMIGTPEYMAPEQAEMSGLDVDTRADIYSLGVLLYELLTGTKPHDLREMLKSGYEEMIRTIREVDPQNPSTRVSTLGERLVAVAKKRHTDPEELRKQFKGELDWIVMKALEKDRRRRYETANGFALDIERYLNQQPVEAGPPSRAYRLKKYFQRHRAAVVGTSLVTVVLLAGLIVSSWGYKVAADQRARATQAERDAEREARAAQDARAEEKRLLAEAEARRAEATTNARKAATVVDLLRDLLSSADPSEVRGPKYTVRRLLEDFDLKIGNRLADQPEVEATVRNLLGAAYLNYGAYEKSQAHIGRARDVARETLGTDHVEYATARGFEAHLHLIKGRYQAAERAARDALEAATDESKRLGALAQLSNILREAGQLREAREVLEGAAERAADDLLLRADLLLVQARVDRVLGDPSAAERALREALRIRERALGKEHPEVAAVCTSLALATLRKDPREALRWAERAVELNTRQLGPRHPSTATALNGLCTALNGLQRYKEAETHARAALAILRDLQGETPRFHTVRMNLVTSLAGQLRLDEAEAEVRAAGAYLKHRDDSFGVLLAGNRLGEIQAKRGAYAEALRTSQRTWEEARRYLGPEHPDTLIFQSNIALGLQRNGRFAEAESLSRDAMRKLEERYGERSPMYMDARRHLVSVLSERGKPGDWEEAEGILRQIVRVREEQEVVQAAAASRLELGSLLYRVGRYQEAAHEQRHALDTLERLEGRKNPERRALARTLAKLGRLEEAESLARDALVVLEDLLGRDHPTYAYALLDYASVLAIARQYKRQRELLEEAVAIAVRALGPRHYTVARLKSSLAFAEIQLEVYDRAEALFDESIEAFDATHGGLNRESAVVWKHKGDLHRQLRNVAQARACYEKSLEHTRASFGKDSPSEAGALTSIAQLEIHADEIDSAVARLKRALDLNPHHVRALRFMRDLRIQQKRFDEAIDLMNQSLAILRRYYGEDHPAVASDRRAAAVTLYRAGQLDRAEELFRAELKFAKERFEPPHKRFGYLLTYLSMIERDRGDLPKALDLADRAYEMYSGHWGESDGRMANSHVVLATIHDKAGRPKKAEAAFRRAVALAMPRTSTFADARGDLARLLARQERWEEADRLWDDIVGWHERISGADSARVAIALDQRASFYGAHERLDKAAEYFYKSQTVFGRALGDRPTKNRAVNDFNLALALVQLGKIEEAMEAYELGMRQARALKADGLAGTTRAGLINILIEAEKTEYVRRVLDDLPTFDFEGATDLVCVGWGLIVVGEFAKAEKALRKCVDIRRREIPDSWLRYNAESLLGAALAGTGAHEEAERLLVNAYEKMDPPEVSRKRKQQALQRVIDFYEQTGDEAKAADYRARKGGE
jgi:tetratricopeptide (TPR) repeat protein